MKQLHIATLLVAAAAVALPAEAENVHIATPKTSLVLDATEGAPLRFLYYGATLADTDIDNLRNAGAPNLDAYPVYGLWPEKEAAFSAVHADGNMTTDMQVVGVSRRDDADGSHVTTG